MGVGALLVILSLLFLHWLGDFVLQSHKMATNKSTSNKWLGLHCLTYMVPFILIGFKYALVNGMIHFCVDYVTSRKTAKLYAKGDIHNFFVVVGLDQMLHYFTLITTYALMIG